MGTLDPREHEDLGDLVGLAVSAHVVIDREGAMVQYVPLIDALGMPVCQYMTVEAVQ